MSNNTTLFAHIIPWLTDRIEDAAVEALGYILSNSPAARRALAETLKIGDIEFGPIDRVETWETGSEGEIPDLVCFDDKGEKQVLIEAKFWADLTKNQPNQYLKQLLEDRQDGPAALLFVAPKARLDLLWPELCELAKEKFRLASISNSDPVRSATIENSSHHLQLTSWATLLESLEKAACGVGDNIAAADIRQLRGLTDQMDGDAYLPLRPEDLRSESAMYMLDVAHLVDDATYHASKNGWTDTEGARATPQRRGYGRFVSIGGVGTWFGIHSEGWARKRDTPLWLSFHENNRVHLKRADLDKDCIEIEGRLCIPVVLPDAENYQEVLNAVVNRLGEYAKQFDASVPGSSHRIDSDFNRKWHQMKLGPEFAERMLGVAKLVDVAARLTASGAEEGGSRWANTVGLKRIINPRREGYGRFIRISGVKSWLGIHYGAWARHCDTPLWLTFEYNERPEQAKMNEKVFEIGGKYCLPIDVPADAESDKALDSVVKRLKEIAERLTGSGG